MRTDLYKFRAKNGKYFDIIAPSDIEFPSFELEFYEGVTNCGAGSGIGDLIVPESIYFVRITLACFVHDDMWSRSAPSWKDFHHSNSVFLSNLTSIIRVESWDNYLNAVKRLRMYRATTYFNAVDNTGKYIFWEMHGGMPKEKQC